MKDGSFRMSRFMVTRPVVDDALALMGSADLSREKTLSEVLKFWSDADCWAKLEFGNAELGDPRRILRLVDLAQKLGARPATSLPEATLDWATLKAAYRFFDNKAVEKDKMLQSHVLSTYTRLRAVPLVLAVQDTSLIDYTSHPNTTGMGPLASAYQHGFLAHSTLAFTPERIPLGLMAQKLWARDAEHYANQVHRRKRAIEDKESNKWLESLEAVITAREACPDTHFVSVGDREADVYELFVKERPEGVDLLVRAAWDRTTHEPEKYLWNAMATADIAAEITIQVPRRKGLPARKTKPAKPDQPARQARLDVRYKRITLRPPCSKKDAPKEKRLPTVALYAVWAVETLTAQQLEAGIEAVEWMLLTSVAVTTAEEALERLEWYACRWGIEVWHKVLKSGCRIEAKQMETLERLMRCFTLYSVIAWRIFFCTMLAREVPEIPCTVLLEEDEWKALYCKIHRRSDPPIQPPTLYMAVRWIASLGGFLGRKHDGEPGPTVLWRGFQHLAALTEMYRIMARKRPPLNVGND